MQTLNLVPCVTHLLPHRQGQSLLPRNPALLTFRTSLVTPALLVDPAPPTVPIGASQTWIFFSGPHSPPSFLISFMQLPSLEWAGPFFWIQHSREPSKNEYCLYPSLFYGDSWHTWHCVTSLSSLSHWFLAIIQMDAIQGKETEFQKAWGCVGFRTLVRVGNKTCSRGFWFWRSWP